LLTRFLLFGYMPHDPIIHAAHIFIFYYAVLAEVTPPTALNAFAAAALTGGDPYKTTMLSWKDTLPAFLVPFMFSSHASGVGLLLKGDLMNIILTNLTALVGVGVLAAGMSGWLFRRTVWVERVLLIAAGFILVYPAPLADAVAVRQWLTRTPADRNKKGIAINP